MLQVLCNVYSMPRSHINIANECMKKSLCSVFFGFNSNAYNSLPLKICNDPYTISLYAPTVFHFDCAPRYMQITISHRISSHNLYAAILRVIPTITKFYHSGISRILFLISQFGFWPFISHRVIDGLCVSFNVIVRGGYGDGGYSVEMTVFFLSRHSLISFA